MQRVLIFASLLCSALSAGPLVIGEWMSDTTPSIGGVYEAWSFEIDNRNTRVKVELNVLSNFGCEARFGSSSIMYGTSSTTAIGFYCPLDLLTNATNFVRVGLPPGNQGYTSDYRIRVTFEDALVDTQRQLDTTASDNSYARTDASALGCSIVRVAAGQTLTVYHYLPGVLPIPIPNQPPVEMYVQEGTCATAASNQAVISNTGTSDTWGIYSQSLTTAGDYYFCTQFQYSIGVCEGANCIPECPVTNATSVDCPSCVEAYDSFSSPCGWCEWTDKCQINYDSQTTCKGEKGSSSGSGLYSGSVDFCPSTASTIIGFPIVAMLAMTASFFSL